MGCSWVQKHLLEYIDGDLAASDRSAIEEHLKACSACAAEVEALERTFALLGDDGYREPSPFFWTRFRAEIMERARGDHSQLWSPWIQVVPRLASVAVAVVFFAFGLWLGLGPLVGSRTRTSGSPAMAEWSRVSREPLISETSKLLAGRDDIYRHASYAADTLWPESFIRPDQTPPMVLTSDDPAAQRMMRIQQLLERRLLKD